MTLLFSRCLPLLFLFSSAWALAEPTYVRIKTTPVFSPADGDLSPEPLDAEREIWIVDRDIVIFQSTVILTTNVAAVESLVNPLPVSGVRPIKLIDLHYESGQDFRIEIETKNGTVIRNEVFTTVGDEVHHRTPKRKANLGTSKLIEAGKIEGEALERLLQAFPPPSSGKNRCS